MAEITVPKMHYITQDLNLDSEKAQLKLQRLYSNCRAMNTNISCNHKSHFLNDFYQADNCAQGEGISVNYYFQQL